MSKQFEIPKGYEAPPWIEDGGDPWKNGGFNPNAYDPAAGYIPRGRTYRLESNPTHVFEDPFDLNNLRILDKQEIERILQELEEVVRKEDERDITIIFGQGGTLACESGNGETVPVLTVKQLLEDAGGNLEKRFYIANTSYPKLIDSSEGEIDYEADLVIAVSWIWKNASAELRKKLVAFKVTRGTDTKVPAGIYMQYMLGPNCPFTVGVISAQKTPGTPYPDGPVNFRYSFDGDRQLHDAGEQTVYLCAGGSSGGLYLPVGAQKITDGNVVGFASPLHPMIMSFGSVEVGEIKLPFRQQYRALLGQEMVPTDFHPIILRGYDRTIQIESRYGMNPQQVFNMIVRDTTDAIAVTLTSFGTFTANPKIVKAIKKACEETGKIFFSGNPFPEGSTLHTYPTANLLRETSHSTHILPSAFVAKIALGAAVFGNNRNKLIDFIVGNNLVGEHPPRFWDSSQIPADTTVNTMGAPREFFERVR